MGHGAVGEREAPGIGDSFLGLLAFHDLGSKQKLFDLVLGEIWLVGWLICGNRQEFTSQTQKRGERINLRHGRRSTVRVQRYPAKRLEVYSFALRRTT